MTTDIPKQIQIDVALCLFKYGNEATLFDALEKLIMEWFEKGLNTREGINLHCPHCNQVSTVYHEQWDSLTCWFCKRDVERKDFITP